MYLGVVQVIPQIFFMPAAPLTEVYRGSKESLSVGNGIIIRALLRPEALILQCTMATGNSWQALCLISRPDELNRIDSQNKAHTEKTRNTQFTRTPTHVHMSI